MNTIVLTHTVICVVRFPEDGISGKLLKSGFEIEMSQLFPDFESSSTPNPIVRRDDFAVAAANGGAHGGSPGHRHRRVPPRHPEDRRLRAR